MYEDITTEQIKARILARLSTDLQTREGSYTNDVVSASAAEIAECYHSLDALIPSFYLDETSGTYIDRQAELVGIVRKAGTKAVCEVQFTGNDGAQVPADTPFYTDAGLEYRLQETVVIRDGTAVGTLTAAEVGQQYNVGAGEITQTLRNYSGISGYTNRPASGGTDPETDAALLARYLTRMRQSATSGNAYHYQQWASSVAGVGASRVIAKRDGPGTVQVLLLSPGLEPASADTVSACAAYIETQRPVGVAVTVSAAKTKSLTVAAQVQIDGSTTRDAVQRTFSTAVKAYLAELIQQAYRRNLDADLDDLTAAAYTVSYHRISALLLTVPGVVDYTALTVNGGTENLSIAADEVPVLKGVTIT